MPHGGPLSYTLSGTHRLDIGRDPYLEWCLPDPTVSSRHCEIRFPDGAYWLNDVSRNGTFVNQTTQRVQEPCRLRTGDRLYIGQYIIDVRIDGEAGMRQEPDVARPPFGAAGADTWADSLGAPGPIDPGLLKPSGRPGPVGPDFSAQLIDMPEGPAVTSVRRRPATPFPGSDLREKRGALPGCACNGSVPALARSGPERWLALSRASFPRLAAGPALATGASPEPLGRTPP